MPTSTGFPGRANRLSYGVTMHDERRTVDPSREFNAAQANLCFWQGGGLGICAPKAVLSYSTAETALLRYGAFSWDQTVYRSLSQPNLSYLTITGNGVGESPYTFTFESEVAGRPDENGDATLNALSFNNARAQLQGDVDSQGSTAEVTKISNLVFEVRTYENLPRVPIADVTVNVEFF